MDPEAKKMLEENFHLLKENNEMLRKMLRMQRWAQIYRVLYWFVILAISFGAVYFIRPYLDSLLGYYGSMSESVDSVKKVGSSVPDLKHIQDLLNQIQN